MAAKFDEAAHEFNILGGPDDPKVEIEEVDESDDDDFDEEDDDDCDDVVEGETDECLTDCSVGKKRNVTEKTDKVEKDSAETRDMSAEIQADKNDKTVESNVKAENTDKDNAGCDQTENDSRERINENEKVNESTDSSDEEDLRGKNRSFRPFRNEESIQHVNTHLVKGRARTSDSICSTSTTSSIAPEVIRAKVKKQQKKQQDRLKARRIRKSGEASLQTKQKRDTQLDIRQSTSAFWF